MTRDRLRSLSRLQYRLPGPILARLRQVEIEVARSDLPPNVRALRTHALNRSRELRGAALFCHGMGSAIGVPVAFADYEAQDYDFVATWTLDGTQHFALVQLKEVVPRGVNPAATIQDEINKLTKYGDAKDLTVAIHLAQAGRFDPAALVIPKLNIGSLWVFAGITPDQSQWAIWGNFVDVAGTPVVGRRFDYPT